MPNDILIIAPLSAANLNAGQLHGIGHTEFVFEPYQNDVQFDGLHQVRVITGTTKLVQSIMRVLLTTIGTSFEDGEWGADINSTIGTKMSNDNYAVIRESVIRALKHYNDLNQDNPDSDEVINTIDELQVVTDPSNPMVIRIVVGVTTESGLGLRVVAPQVIN